MEIASNYEYTFIFVNLTSKNAKTSKICRGSRAFTATKLGVLSLQRIPRTPAQFQLNGKPIQTK